MYDIRLLRFYFRLERMMITMGRYNKYLTNCVSCGEATTKHFARSHEAKCKACFSGVEPKHVCPDCGGPISAWKLRQSYHCESCTRQADPVGYANEVMGYNDYPNY